MKFKNIKLNKKVKLYDLLDEERYIRFILSIIFTSFIIFLLFGVYFYTIASKEIQTIINNILNFFFTVFVPLSLLILVITYISINGYYLEADRIKGLLKSRYLPISDDEIQKLNINNLKNYLEFINDFTKEKVLLKTKFYYYILYLHDKHIEFINELAKKEYNEEITFIRTSSVNDKYLDRFCLFKKNNKIYLAFQDDKMKYYKGNYDIPYHHDTYPEEITYMI